METAQDRYEFDGLLRVIAAVVRLAHRDAESVKRVYMCHRDEQRMWHQSAKRFLAEWQVGDRKIPLGKQVLSKGVDRW